MMIRQISKLQLMKSMKKPRTFCPARKCKRQIYTSSKLLEQDFYHQGVFPTDLTEDASQLIMEEESPINKNPSHKFNPDTYTTTDKYCYNTLNFEVKGYDIVNVEAFAQFVHRFLKQENVFIEEVYSLPTAYKAIKHIGTKGDFTSVGELPTVAELPVHYRIVQVSKLKTNLLPLYTQKFINDLPMAVMLSVKEYTAAEHKLRYKENEELIYLKQEYAELEATK